MGLIRTSLFLAGTGIIGYAIYRHFSKQAQLAKQYEYRIVDIGVNKLTKKVADLDLILEIHNKSSFKANIIDLQLDVFLEGKYVGEIIENSTLMIPAESKRNWDLRLVFDPSVVASNLANLLVGLLDKGDINIRVQGTAKIDSEIINFNLPIEATYGKDYLLPDQENST